MWVPACFIPIWVQNDFLPTNYPLVGYPYPQVIPIESPYQHLPVTCHTHPQVSTTVTQDGLASTPFSLSSLPTCSHSEDVGYLAEFKWVFRGLFVSLYVLLMLEYERCARVYSAHSIHPDMLLLSPFSFSFISAHLFIIPSALFAIHYVFKRNYNN